MRNDIVQYIQELNKDKIIEILQYRDTKQEELFDIARNIRKKSKFKDFVELRSVIEMSNVCSQKCNYCSISSSKNNCYTLEKEIILDKIFRLANIGRRTFLLQSGENHSEKFIEDVAYCCHEAVNKYPDIKIILCMGNLKYEQYKLLKDAGAKRYILKFETSNPQHHKFCRPNDTIENRLEKIQMLIDMGFQTGSGNITGLPKQTFDNLYEDLVLINKLNLSMVSTTRFIPNELSAFAKYPYGNLDTTINFLAILRILKPNCLIPSTSSLSMDKKDGQAKGLMAGCNTITIHDGTPKEFEEKYSIYNQKRFSPAEEYCKNIIENAGLIPKQSLI